MVPWVAWVVFLAVAAVLWVTGSNFSVRTVRWVTAVIAVGLFAAITAYGLSRTPGPGMPPARPGDVQTAFVKGTDAIVASLFYPLRMGRSAWCTGPSYHEGQITDWTETSSSPMTMADRSA